jgi:hypothetical protein
MHVAQYIDSDPTASKNLGISPLTPFTALCQFLFAVCFVGIAFCPLPLDELVPPPNLLDM